MNAKADPVLKSVIANRLDSITKEMGKTMLRTSRSPIFSEARDFVTAIFDHELRLIAQTAYIPVLVAATPFAVQSIAAEFAGDIHDGDVFILNDPYRGNNHPPDVTIARPVFCENSIAFWAVTKGHQADIGGGGAAGYNPAAQSVWDEGVRIPPIKLYDRGRENKGVWQMILSNVRLIFLVEGDIRCLIGATKVGERNLQLLLEKYDLALIDEIVNEILDASERQMREELRRIPNGRYRAERCIDNDGIVHDRPVKICVDIEVKDEEIVFDYSGSDAQVAGYVNSPFPNTASATYLSVYSLVDPDLRQNAGAMRPIKCIAPEGSVLNPRDPAPSTACTVLTAEAIMEAAWLALSDAIPDRVQACWARWCGPATAGFNPRTGRPFGEIHFMSKGGGGATQGFDGWDHVGTVICLGGLRSPDPELHELSTPYFIEEFEFQPDSAGAGKWRGGMGVNYRWRVDADDLLCANFGSGTIAGTEPFGLHGGGTALRNYEFLQETDGTMKEVTVNTVMPLQRGQKLQIRSGGGGGFGCPNERALEKVAADVRDGLVSVASARDDYAVVIDPGSFEIDIAATAELRSG
jgi:N-methylhydantoinase B